MSLTVDRIVIPTMIRTLNALKGLLEKGEAFAVAKGMQPADILNASLIDDMHPLKRQIQMVTDTVRRVLCQLAEQDVIAVEDTEETFAELQTRIDSTLAFIDAFDSGALAGSEDKTITLPLGDNGLELDGATFLMGFAMPNFYFHAATAYNILRMRGVDVGKMDFLGRP
ncbi:MAG: DUF1993 domain-containing protein [Pseudomonadales bacterium]|nr:DUF1993 domain-containing protein [Pseudomonadales bacterium]